MKNIAVFCDGTWNTPESKTNVFRLYKATRTRDAGQCEYVLGPGDVAQVSNYFWGVGTDEENDIGWWDKMTFGAFGKGLDGILYRAYKWVCQVYEPGDRIFVFGFSRGAYTARSLIGLMRTCGIIDADKESTANDALIDQAMDLYRKRDKQDGADFKRAVEFRSANACAWVDDKLTGWTKEKLGRELNPRGMLRFRYLGIWDTVGALGIPEKIPLSKHVNTKYRFHDCALSSTVEFARHAVAIDEYRHAFEPTLWTRDSMAAINNLHRNNRDEPWPRVEQDWFPGDHGSVGGGGDIDDLCDAALVWVAEGARNAGLLLDWREGQTLSRLATRTATYDPLQGPVKGPIRNVSGEPAWYKKLAFELRGLGGRTNLDENNACTLRHPADLSDGALARIRDNKEYLDPSVGNAEARRQVGYRKRTLAAVLRRAADPSSVMTVASTDPEQAPEAPL
jgi:uncharacterized protein (DUF2235 family)